MTGSVTDVTSGVTDSHDHADITDLTASARQSASQGDWGASLAAFMELDAAGALDPADLPLFAEVAYAAGHLDLTIAAWERAHAASMAAGDRVGAAGAAARTAMHLLFDTALMAPVRGWLRRAERLLEDEPPSAAHAWCAVVRTYERLLSGDGEAARHWARRAVEVGSECDPAAAAVGRVAEARLLLLEGDVGGGLALLEDVGVATVAGDLDPLSTGVVYCDLVCALQGVAQYDLAEEWTEAMERWCETNAIGSLHGRCRVHRAEILRLRGSCDAAEQEAVAACDELRSYLGREMGWPLTELGEIRLRRGDLTGAEVALTAAHRAGWDPQPALARVRLAEGDLDTALESVRHALGRPLLVPSKERPPSTDLQRAPLLEALVEMEIAAGDIDSARAAADELDVIARRFTSRALVAGAAVARGRVRLAEGDATGAEEQFREAARLWGEIGAPYELAAARSGLAAAHRAQGREHEARLELDAARILLDHVRRGADRPGDEVQMPAQPASEINRLRREGDVWSVTFADRTVRIRDLKGIHHLVRLLADPGREFHALDLVTAEPGNTTWRGDAGALLDDQARTAYRRRLAEIEADIDEARSTGDVHRAAQAERERDFLTRELSRAFGLGGATRKAGAASERARVAVTRAIRTALARIAEHHPALGEHLHHAVRTGTYCSYQPDPRAPARWEL